MVTEILSTQDTYRHNRLASTVVCLDITNGTYNQIQNDIILAAKRRQNSTVCFANVHMTVEAACNKQFADIVNSANWVTADGVPILWAIRALHGRRQERITGLDLLPDLLQRAAEEGLKVFFYGSTPDVLADTVAICKLKWPSLHIAGVHSPPFRTLTAAEEDEDVNRIVESDAQLVFVALGCPRQEVWISQMRARIPAVLLGIGGALPVLAGHFPRAPRWMQKTGLEWFFRLSQEPFRLFHRYMTTNTMFVLYLFRSLVIKR